VDRYSVHPQSSALEHEAPVPDSEHRTEVQSGILYLLNNDPCVMHIECRLEENKMHRRGDFLLPFSLQPALSIAGDERS
jgi:hypothetical protein